MHLRASERKLALDQFHPLLNPLSKPRCSDRGGRRRQPALRRADPRLARACTLGIGAQLLSLIRKEFLRPDGSLFPGDDGFRFNHILIRDAAHDSMPKQLRADLHDRYTDWLEQRVDLAGGGDVPVVGDRADFAAPQLPPRWSWRMRAVTAH